MVYEKFYEELERLHPDLYWKLGRVSLDYQLEAARLAEAQLRNSPSSLQLIEQVAGRYGDLERTALEINQALGSGSEQLPTSREDLTRAVAELTEQVFMQRHR